MARTPFKMRSGNSTPFKQMGSSPVKDMKTGKYEQSFESPVKKTYKEAYSKNLTYKSSEEDDDYTKVDKYGREYGGEAGFGEAEFTKAAKAWNMKTYGTHNPTADAKKAGMTKKELATKHKTSKTKTEVKLKTPKTADAKMEKDLDVAFAGAEKGAAKAQKEVKAFGKEIASTVTRKDLKKDKKAKLKGKTMREKQAIRKEYRTAKKTLKTLKKEYSPKKTLKEDKKVALAEKTKYWDKRREELKTEK